MAGKRDSSNGNGHGNGKDPVVNAIHELTAEVRTLQRGQEQTNARLESVEQVLRGHGRQLGEVVDRLGRVEVRLERVEDRLDNIRDLAGERYRALEERVARIEERLH
jgi:chromosome segregation ATPase